MAIPVRFRLTSWLRTIKHIVVATRDALTKHLQAFPLGGVIKASLTTGSNDEDAWISQKDLQIRDVQLNKTWKLVQLFVVCSDD